jgi:hypothetical protein
MRSRFSPTATASISLISLVALTGCYQGIDATVNSQGPTGNGTDVSSATNPNLGVQDATIVIESGKPGPGSLIFSLVNTGTTPDTLKSVVTDPGSSVTVPSGGIPVAPKSTVIVGQTGDPKVTINGINTAPSSFVKVTFTFEKAGSVDAEVLTVPPTGYYAPGGSNL